MVKLLLAAMVLVLLSFTASSQENSYTQPPALGIHFVFVDFKTATAIRKTSLTSVLAKKQFSKLKDMSQGLAISYSRGLSDHYDFSSTFLGSILSYPLDAENTSASEYPLLELDASLRGKMLSDKYWFNPYVQLGVGFSKYQGYWNAFIPAGLGIQISFFGEAYLLINAQYRIAVTEAARYHFIYSLGLVGNIGK